MPELKVKIITPEQVIFDGPAQAISTANEGGDLSVIPQHTNFISIIQDKLSVVKPDGTTQDIPVDQGILYCRANEVNIYIGIDTALKAAELEPSIK